MERALIHNVTLGARELLIKEVWDLFRGVYGLDPKGNLEKVEKLPALQQVPEAQETRQKLEKYLEDEEKAGQKRAKATEKLAKEVAFTHLNRLVAFKMMEGRKLIRGTIDRHHSSNGFIFYLADHPEEMAMYEGGSLPQNALGEGPRDTAYRHFLLAQSAEMAEEIKVLFDPDNLASRLFPRPRALKDLIDMLNDPALKDAWAPDNEETIGWIYQYFTEEEKKAVFDRLYKKKHKIRPEDIPAATQLFTPRWIVKFLAQNTLGRLWVQMHPDSRLVETLDYLVPLAGEIPPVPMKPVREIETLDPACGTMHFGLVAFDLLAEMYREEMARAGEPGWPERPSAESEEEIPAAILANNIFGIDIALRAVQLSALALYLKAKTLNPKAKITESHLACAEIELPDDSWLENFFDSRSISNPVYERVVRALWAQIKENSVKGAGSLLPLEEVIGDLVATEKKRHQSTLQGLEDLAEMDPEAEKIEFWGEDFWPILEDQVVKAFDYYAREHDETFFAGEVTKGMRLLDIMRRRYDAVFTNPPYLSRKNMYPLLADFLAAYYPKGKGDLYTAFIERCLRLTKDEGRCGMVTIHSFMFISSYEKLREEILDATTIETGCHLGTKTEFDVANKTAQGFASFVLRRDSEKTRNAKSIGTWYRLTHADGEEKRNIFEQFLTRLYPDENPVVFHYRQDNFEVIPGGPWVYWITPGLRRLFKELPKLGEIAKPRQGLATADNLRFLRFWWEAGADQVGFGCKSREEAQFAGMKWFPYMKGGSFQRWCGNQEYVVNWLEDGAEIRTIGMESGRIASRAQNTDFYFRRGITYSFLTSAKFNARLSPGGFIFDVAGSSMFPEDIPLVLAVMNSSITAYSLKLINPTVNFQVGDLARLPTPTESSKKLDDLVDRAISLARADSADDETTFDFIAPPWTGSLDDTLTELYLREEALADVEAEIDEEVYRLYGISEEDRAAIEAELSGPGEDGEGGEAPEPSPGIDDEELGMRWISYALGIAMGRFSPGTEEGLGRGRFSPEAAERLRSLADKDGVATLDEGHQDDLARKVYSALEIALGEEGANEVISVALGDENGDPERALRRHFERDFFKAHLKKYRKRPVYWLFQSPKKSYSVYVFHEKATVDTLPLILGNRYVAGKINQLKNRIDEVNGSKSSSAGREKKRAEKELEGLETALSDLLDFEKALRQVLEAKDERSRTAGWTPEIDDGVILNLAPLRDLMPSWKEPAKFWKGLEAGDYDWSYTAMRYWPDRVLEKCRANKSYAIAHNRLDVYEGDR
ncbi:MAG: BREX-1 system adenine-specific DNA-methyltransferase PglX [Methanothrix sp.]|jgi:hypothetical protein|nr:BREX-1 system adenine-specific DNA-methyltransferase PglX [Methanothrix sp.]